MVCSTWAANLMWVLLGANWILEGRWKEKWQMARNSRALQAYVAFCLILLVGMLWTTDSAAGWTILRVKLPLLVVPLVMLTTPPLHGRVRNIVLWLFAGTVLVVSIISSIRLFTIEGLPYREAVPYISHIRFALCCCMVIFISLAGLHRSKTPLPVVTCIVLALWMLCFLILIRSYTAIAVLLAVSLAAALHWRRRWWAVALWVAVVGGAAIAVGCEVHRYYSPVPMATAPLRATTDGGRPYYHAQDGIIENGNLLNNYICLDELRNEWPHRSAVPLDSDMNDGYSLEAVLIRHLNALNLTKDSAGLWAMPDEAVRAVERGVANPVYESRNQLRKMVYVMLFEREHYVHTGSVVGFTMLQRFELWRATWRVVKAHPIAGVGTGDAVNAVHAELTAMDSALAGTAKHTHNVYLTLLAMVGALGFAAIVAMALRAMLSYCRSSLSGSRTPLMIAWLIVILISFITEDSLDTLAGILFCTWFLFARHGSPHHVQ